MTAGLAGGASRAPIAVALDAPDLATALAWAGATAPHVSTLKVGLESYLRDGDDAVIGARRAAEGSGSPCDLFLDLKLHDIPATVAGAARSVARLAPDYLTVHAAGGPAMVRAAAETLPDTRIVAVTVLTSLQPGDLCDLGLLPPGADADAVRALAVTLAASAIDAGARAVVCSPEEVAEIRAAVGPGPVLITPGVRPAGADRGDQRRVATPREALDRGADLLVIGRPITGAEDPAAAAARIAADLGVRAGTVP
ncbi:MAG: orotidine-5'-phosphate decarboxylase [bacterium]